MAVKRIVANIKTDSIQPMVQFYQDVFGLDLAMDLGWISTLVVDEHPAVQLSIATQGGSGTDVPDLSIEVDDVDAVHAKALEMGCAIEYALTDEPWGVRRFYLRDPSGKLLNVLSHSKS